MAHIEELVVRSALPTMDAPAMAFSASEHGWASLLREDLPADVRARLVERTRESVSVRLDRLGSADGAAALADWLVPARAKSSGQRAEPGLPASLREAGIADGSIPGLTAELARAPETIVASSLFAACARIEWPADPLDPVRDTVDRLGRDRTPRDVLVALGMRDPNGLVGPVMVRLAAAYLDEGIARRHMPGRERGLLASFRAPVSSPMEYRSWRLTKSAQERSRPRDSALCRSSKSPRCSSTPAARSPTPIASAPTSRPALR